MSDDRIRIGVIGGSGLYNMPQLVDINEIQIDTPFGLPSDLVVTGTLNGARIAFIPRHGRGHIYLPSEVPYRANIYALKTLGVEWLISVSACGSLREDYAPGHVVVPDQLYDNTRDNRDRTFFGDGLVAHVSVADPFCDILSGMLVSSIHEAGGTSHHGGTFVTVEGPRFSTRAESNVYRAVGHSIIGMTTSPEAYLAREAEMCYAVMGHVTDYDVWHESEEPVTVDMVVKTLNENIELARQTLAILAGKLRDFDQPCQHRSALANAILTDRRKVPPQTIERLKPIVRRYFE